jgi:hypothetical protein
MTRNHELTRRQVLGNAIPIMGKNEIPSPRWERVRVRAAPDQVWSPRRLTPGPLSDFGEGSSYLARA